MTITVFALPSHPKQFARVNSRVNEIHEVAHGSTGKIVASASKLADSCFILLWYNSRDSGINYFFVYTAT